MLYEFHPLAARELSETVDYYESLAPGKGLELVQQIKVAIDRICEFPESSPIIRGQVRALLIQPSTDARGFPGQVELALKHIAVNLITQEEL